MKHLAVASLPDFVELSPEGLRDAASLTALEVDVLSAAGGPSRIRQIRSPGGWAFDTAMLNAHVRARGGFGADHIAVLSVMRGGDATICGVPLEDGVVMTIAGGTDIAASIRPGVAYSTAVLPIDVWADIVGTATGDDAPSRLPRAIRMQPAVATRHAARLGTALACFDALHAPASAEMPAALVDYLGSAAAALAGTASLDLHLDRSLRARLRQASRAEDFIQANLEQPLPIQRICREVGVSRRQLEYAFHTAFGVGPGEYIRLARLNEARRRLQTARVDGRTVTQVALDAGVSHLGRFAVNYRRLFGETPQQTLRTGR